MDRGRGGGMRERSNDGSRSPNRGAIGDRRNVATPSTEAHESVVATEDAPVIVGR